MRPKRTLVLTAVLLVAVFVAYVGISITGYVASPEIPADAIRDSAMKWLQSDHGRGFFPGAEIYDIVPVLKNKALVYWIVIFESGGELVGHFSSTSDTFDVPDMITKYGSKRPDPFSVPKDEAYRRMIETSGYLPAQVKTPYLAVSEDGGLFWTSEVAGPFGVIDILQIETSID